jgi:hypothetical protein
MFELGSEGRKKNSNRPTFYNRVQDSISYTAFKIFLLERIFTRITGLKQAGAEQRVQIMYCCC